MKKKILFSSGGTGGHVFPSISLISFLKKKDTQQYSLPIKEVQNM